MKTGQETENYFRQMLMLLLQHCSDSTSLINIVQRRIQYVSILTSSNIENTETLNASDVSNLRFVKNLVCAPEDPNEKLEDQNRDNFLRSEPGWVGGEEKILEKQACRSARPC